MDAPLGAQYDLVFLGSGAGGGCMCCTALCCSCVTTPQLFAKVLGNKAAFAKWFAILLILRIMLQIGQQFGQSQPVVVYNPDMLSAEVSPMGLVWSCFQVVGGLGTVIIVTVLLMAVRKRIREKDQIPEGACGGCDDCCCSFCCSCCITIQMFHHLGISQQTGYKLCDPEGIPTVGGPAV